MGRFQPFRCLAEGVLREGPKEPPPPPRTHYYGWLRQASLCLDAVTAPSRALSARPGRSLGDLTASAQTVPESGRAVRSKLGVGMPRPPSLHLTSHSSFGQVIYKEPPFRFRVRSTSPETAERPPRNTVRSRLNPSALRVTSTKYKRELFFQPRPTPVSSYVRNTVKRLRS